MSYSNVLKNIVANANITQEQLSIKCKELGSPISRGQLNKLLNAKASAPEEKISRAIAKVCNVDDTELVIEGYLEKAPKEFGEFIEKLQNIVFEISLHYIENVKNLSKNDIESLKKSYIKKTASNFIIEILKDIDLEQYNFEDFKIDKNTEPVILANSIFDKFNSIKMEDDSMQDKIPKGSKIKWKSKNKYKNGEIILVKVRNDEKPIIRTVFFIGQDICVFALNKNYKSLYLKNGEYIIYGSIYSIEIEI